MTDFLPVTREEMEQRGWTQPDFIYVSGDAYVDHPSFGPAIITRMLEAYGYKVCMIPQPDWTRDEPFMEFGEPRLGFLVSSGNIDSMVNHYSVSKRRRDIITRITARWANARTARRLCIPRKSNNSIPGRR